MQKKIIAVAVAGLSTAAFAQTNVTIYGVADVSAQGYTMSQSKAPANGAQGSVLGLQSNSSLIGFKGTEDLGNGLKALFQAETTLYLTGNSAVSENRGSLFGTNSGSMRDSFVGLNSKYGSGMIGYMSTPLRQSLTSFDVIPGATGSTQIDAFMTTMRFGSTGVSTGALQYAGAVRATAIAYSMPTLYGFNGSIAYTGSANNGTSNTSTPTGSCNDLSACTQQAQGVFGFNLGWTGYGVNVQGAFQQANYNLANPAQTATVSGGAVVPSAAVTGVNALGNYTNYLVGAAYTGLPGLKVSAVYARNTLGTNGASVLTASGAGKITNNQFMAGASYRMGNWEPRIKAIWMSDADGSDIQQMGSRLWTANLGYYLSKRTQVYGMVANLNNSANQNYSFGQQNNNMRATGGENLFTYGLGMRTTF
jgi:predicted porin